MTLSSVIILDVHQYIHYVFKNNKPIVKNLRIVEIIHFSEKIPYKEKPIDRLISLHKAEADKRKQNKRDRSKRMCIFVLCSF